jgi:hypothetical protein
VVRGIVAAIVAAVFAILSFVAILLQVKIASDQIKLARKQIDMTGEQIEIARREVTLVEADLKYSQNQSVLVQQQMAGLQRKPNVHICFEDGRDLTTVSVRAGSAENVMFYAINRGERTSTNLFAELFVPMVLLVGR